MKIESIKIENYRLLKKLSISLEDNLSLVVGKNNTGKTSLLTILNKFLNRNSFNFEDFNIDSQQAIVQSISSKSLIAEEKYNIFKISLILNISREDSDNILNLTKAGLITDLDHKNKETSICFSYALDYKNYLKLREDFGTHHIEDITEFIKKHHKAYFKVFRVGGSRGDDKNFIEIDESKIRKIIRLQKISAKRNVSNNEDGENKKALSSLSHRYFKPQEDSTNSSVIDLQKNLIEVDKKLTKSYEPVFDKVVKDVEHFSYNGAKISVISNFQEINLLKENTSVVYDEKGIYLPEDYNGLGYMNLFSMIFELHIIFDEFNKKHSDEDCSDINILFMEEPEAHTHPQMQYVFIKKVKEFLSSNKGNLNLQTVITTHSAHITSQSDFDDIKYFLKNKDNEIEVKNLSDLKKQYELDDEGRAQFKFLKQYLTLHKAELFFSDKAIFIEGTTERILLPAIMQKLDYENKNKPTYSPLLSQKISVVEVGAHSKSFEKFIEFLEIKTLIITDLDSIAASRESCPVSVGVDTSNASIKHYLSGKNWKYIRDIKDKDRIISVGKAPVYLTYQCTEKKYHARSFEDSFLALNLNYVEKNKDNFSSLKPVIFKREISKKPLDYYAIAEAIDSKPGFATDVLFYSSEDYKEWNTPSYLKKGLLWLMKK